MCVGWHSQAASYAGRAQAIGAKGLPIQIINNAQVLIQLEQPESQSQLCWCRGIVINDVQL